MGEVIKGRIVWPRGPVILIQRTDGGENLGDIEHDDRVVVSITKEREENMLDDVTLLVEGRPVYEGNISRDLVRMANEVYLADALWRPDEIGATKARYLIMELRVGLTQLVAEPFYFRRFDPLGRGDYESLVSVVREYLEACETWPDAEVQTWR